MAAYGSLLSLMTLIENIQLYHAHYPKFLDKHQNQLESLHKVVTSLQYLLEWCSNNSRNEAGDLESLIVDAANGAEDIIEIYIAGDIRARSWKDITGMNTGYTIYTDFYQMDGFFSEELQKVIEDMKLLDKEIMKIKEKNKDEDQQEPYLLPSVSLEYPQGVYDIGMVGFKDEFNEIMNKLNAHISNLEIISITGMGGIGKSTLARHVLDNKSIVDRFDVRGWFIFSEEFRARERLSHLLTEFEVPHGDNDEYHVLGEKLHKHLWGRRFLIVVDDIWSVEDWDKFKIYLPDNGNKSRIILTTRLLNVATDVGSSHICNVNFLDEDTSWCLLSRKAFFNHICPPELQNVGKRIARNCKGLPLSLAVIGGLLSKLEKTRVCWKKIAGEVNMIVSTEDDERCSKILSLSYRHLPIYLKPCFLYMGIFPEDYAVPFDSLTDLWIAEGLIKPCGGSKGFEEIAQKYLEDLIQRSLVYVAQSSSRDLMAGTFTFLSRRQKGKIRIHDLLRDLALKEAHKDKFLHVTQMRDPNLGIIINNERRVGLYGTADIEVIYENLVNTATFLISSDPNKVSEFVTIIRKTKMRSLICGTDLSSDNNIVSEFENALSTATFLRSLICDSTMFLSELSSLRLLRVSRNLCIRYSPGVIFQLINSRNLRICHFQGYELESIHLLWNLQVLIVSGLDGETHVPEHDQKPATFRIWEMPLLRNLVMNNFILPDPPQGQMDGTCDLVTNLQEIEYILDLRCTVEVLRKISNVQILQLKYADHSEKGVSHYSLDNLDCLHKLQAFGVWFMRNMNWPCRTDLLQNIGLSQSLKSLFLRQCGFEWELLTTKVGSLPHLEELQLYNCYTGEEWILEEGFFLSLKLLRLRECCNLVNWSAESDHFPCLEHLFLHEMQSLEEIPPGIGETPTLESIHLITCSSSLVSSAKMILQEQLRYGNDGFRVLVSDKDTEEEKEVVGQEVVEGEEDEEVEGEEVEEEEKEVQEQEKKKKKSRGVVAFVIPFLVILGSSYGLLRTRFRGRGRAGSEVKQKKNNDKRQREGDDDSWWLFYEYP